MFVEGTLRWQVTEDCPWDLLLALFLRDLAELRKLDDLALPAVTPPVRWVTQSVQSLGGLASLKNSSESPGHHALQEQWAQWWQRVAIREYRQINSDVHPPHFAVFDRQLELQDLVLAHYDEAAQWATARRQEYLQMTRDFGPQWTKEFGDIIRQREHELRRQAGTFRIDLSVLPLSEPGSWIVGPNSIVVSLSLRMDHEAFGNWFRSLVTALI